MTVEAGKQLGRGIINSIITYFGADSMDILTPDGLPEETVEFLRRMLNGLPAANVKMVNRLIVFW